MKKYILPVLPVILIPLLFYVGGFDFDERGNTAAVCLYITVLCTGLAAFRAGLF